MQQTQPKQQSTTQIKQPKPDTQAEAIKQKGAEKNNPSIDSTTQIQHNKDSIFNQQQVSVPNNIPMPKSIFAVVLVKEIKNDFKKELEAQDVLNALQSFIETERKSQNDSFRVIEDSLIVETNLSTGTVKSTVKIELTESLYEKLFTMANTSHSSVDQKLKINRLFLFNFFDLQGILQTSLFQTGRFQLEFLKLNLGKQSVGKKTTKIFIAYNIKDNQIYAIKKVKLMTKPDWNRLYLNNINEVREIKAMLRLNHKNILRLFNWWFEEEKELVKIEDEEQVKTKQRTSYYLYLQTEYVTFKDQSQDLLEYIYYSWETKNVPSKQRKQKIVVIFDQILDGIQYIHNQGFYHRDIKPENILVSENCLDEIIVKICDFDFAKHLEFQDNVQSRLTGSPGYTSKKSYQGETYDVKEEIFMLGMVLLDCCQLFAEANKRKQYHTEAMQNIFSQMLLSEYKEIVDLFRKMNIECVFHSVEELRKSPQYQTLVNLK